MASCIQHEDTKHPKAHEEAFLVQPRFSSCVFVRFVPSWLMPAVLQRPRERGRTLAVAENPGNAGVRSQLGAAIDGRDRQIELRAISSSRQHDPDRMKQGFPFLTGPRLHAVRDLSKYFAVETRSGHQLRGERSDDR